ncbi:MAG: hypothetical protein EOM11_09380, partial [Erysipelotrichia bacterium]|nr:hypothetical protein [Erysipelotrichia bacterium]
MKNKVGLLVCIALFSLLIGCTTTEKKVETKVVVNEKQETAKKLLAKDACYHFYYEQLNDDDKKLYEEQKNILENFLSSKRGNKPYVSLNEWERKCDKVLIAQLSDIHYGKKVNFEGDDAVLNKYDKDIARKRIDKYFFEIAQTAENNKTKDVIIEMAGDMFSGLIHDELKYFVDSSIMDDIYSLADCLTYNIQNIQKDLNLKIVGVSGNHGRTQKSFEHEFQA